MITIKEFAKREGISRQTVYKSLSSDNGKYTPYVVIVGTQKLIDYEKYKAEVLTVDNTELSTVDNIDNPINEPIQADEEQYTIDGTPEVLTTDNSKEPKVDKFNTQVLTNDNIDNGENELITTLRELIKELEADKEYLKKENDYNKALVVKLSERIALLEAPAQAPAQEQNKQDTTQDTTQHRRMWKLWGKKKSRV